METTGEGLWSLAEGLNIWEWEERQMYNEEPNDVTMFIDPF